MATNSPSLPALEPFITRWMAQTRVCPAVAFHRLPSRGRRDKPSSMSSTFRSAQRGVTTTPTARRPEVGPVSITTIPQGDDGITFQTILNYGTDSNNKWISYYFRQSFVVTNLDGITNMTLGLNR